MLFAAFLAVQAVSGRPDITIREIPGGYRAEAAPFEVTQEVYVNAEIDRRSSDLCGAKRVKWGKFGSLSRLERDPAKEPPKTSSFFKEFSCEVPTEPIVADISSDWKATTKDDADVRSFFATYYARRDSGDLDGAFAMFEPGTRPEESTKAGLLESNRKLGIGSRRITGVTWYVNPATAPRLGAYAALDFVGEYTGVHVYCGYLVLYRLGPGRYEIVREEQNMFQRGDGTADMAQVATMRSAFCREK